MQQAPETPTTATTKDPRPMLSGVAARKEVVGDCILYHGDCLDILPSLSGIDAIITDPPYLQKGDVPIIGKGVTARKEDSSSLGMPWGYSNLWIAACKNLAPSQWVVFCNYAMLGDICTALPPTTVFTWRKSNAPRMARPVPRLDCEFVVWHRNGPCGSMREFDSQVIDVPMPQAGCMATERICEKGTGKALHPCQKPTAVVSPFVLRLPGDVILDPFMGTGTTGISCVRAGKKFIGIERDATYFEIALDRIKRECSQARLF